MTLDEARRDARVFEVLRRFVETQDEWAAEAEALLALTALLPVFGQGRDWLLPELGERLLVRRANGRWALRGVPRVAASAA